MKTTHIPHRSFHRGFTLTELAIVLLVIGVIAGGIWVVAQHTWDNYRVARLNQQMVKVVQNVREYYMNAQGLPAGNITATLDSLPPPNGSLFPIEMRRTPGVAGGLIDNPFNASVGKGSFQVQTIACPAPQTTAVCFQAQIKGLTQEPCIKLLTYIPADDTELGIAQIGTLTGNSGANPTTLISAGTAALWCNQAGGGNEIDIDFKLRN